MPRVTQVLSSDMDHSPCLMKMKKLLVSLLFLTIFLVIFLVIDDENLSQVLSNILQVKERGATVIVITNLQDIY